MLSDDLRDFAACLAGWENGGVQLSPVAVRVLRAQVSAYAIAAESLELQAIPLHQQGTLPPDVVSLDVWRSDRKRGIPRNGGSS